MDQSGTASAEQEPIIAHKLWKDQEVVRVDVNRAGHGDGDAKLHEKIFVHPKEVDLYKRAAGSRDGERSVLIGIAARKSIESGHPVRISELTSLEPRAKRL